MITCSSRVLAGCGRGVPAARAAFQGVPPRATAAADPGPLQERAAGQPGTEWFLARVGHRTSFAFASGGAGGFKTRFTPMPSDLGVLRGQGRKREIRYADDTRESIADSCPKSRVSTDQTCAILVAPGHSRRNHTRRECRRSYEVLRARFLEPGATYQGLCTKCYVRRSGCDCGRLPWLLQRLRTPHSSMVMTGG